MNDTVKKVLYKALGESRYYTLQNKHRRNVIKNKTDKKVDSFHKAFNRIMFEANICDNFDRTITPVNINRIAKGGADGMCCELDFPEGTSVDDLDKCIKKLAQNVYGKCMVYVDDQPGKKVKFSAIQKWHDFPYEPVKGLNASQLFMGYTIDLEPIIVDLTKYPHLLITGGSGGGKGKLVEIIMTNLCYNCGADDLELYYLQLSKDDNWKYELLEHCRGCVTATSVPDKLKNVQMAHRMIRFIYTEMIRRGLEVKEKLGRQSEDMNVHVYNKKFKRKMPVIQLWIDEAASTFKKDPNKDVNKLLEEMTYMIAQISSAGRYVGVYLINVMQRASKDELPREIKINSLNLVSFNQVDGGASKVAIGDETSALGLPPRVFAVKAGGIGAVRFAKTPFSNWNDNVQLLKEKDRVRDASDEELKEILEDVYSVWNDTVPEDKPKTVPNKSTGATTLVSKELKDMQSQLDGALNEIKLLKFDVTNKEQVIKELMSKLDSREPTEEALKQISELEYKGAEKQREEIHELTNCTSEYIQLPVMPGMIKKITKKGEN